MHTITRRHYKPSGLITQPVMFQLFNISTKYSCG